MKLICIPAFNEEARLSDVIVEAKNYADLVVVCDDGSSDNTSKIAISNGAELIRHSKNLGKGSAMKSLFNYAKDHNAELVVMIDGDGQFKANEIPLLIKPILNGYDVVIGNRLGKNSKMPNYRTFGNKVLDKITNIAADLPFEDTQSGFRSYSKKAIESISIQSDGFGSDAEILVNAAQKNLKITDVPVSVLYDIGTKTSTKNPISHTTEVVLSLIELISIRRPLSYLGIPGIIIFAMGIIFSIIVITLFNETRYFSIPYMLLTIGSFTLGLILIMMSVLLFSIKNSNQKN
jgi:glycosyltransferase involved in cell wall biosynthesis